MLIGRSALSNTHSTNDDDEAGYSMAHRDELMMMMPYRNIHFCDETIREAKNVCFGLARLFLPLFSSALLSTDYFSPAVNISEEKGGREEILQPIYRLCLGLS